MHLCSTPVLNTCSEQEYACGASLNVGILGLAYQNLNSLGVPSPLSQMVKEHQLEDVFSLCFKKPSSQYVEDVGSSGAFVVGGIGPASMYTGPVHYAAVVQDQFYSVSLRDMLVNDQSLSMDMGRYNVIVDSGTTNLLLPSPVYARLNDIVTSLNDVVEFRLRGLAGPDVLLRVTYADLNGNIGDAGSNFILGRECRRACAGFVGADTACLLAEPLFWGHHVVFNRTLNAVGFAVQGDCNAAHRSPKRASTTTLVMAIVIPLVMLLGGVAMCWSARRTKLYEQSLQQNLVEAPEEY